MPDKQAYRPIMVDPPSAVVWQCCTSLDSETKHLEINYEEQHKRHMLDVEQLWKDERFSKQFDGFI